MMGYVYKSQGRTKALDFILLAWINWLLVGRDKINRSF